MLRQNVYELNDNIASHAKNLYYCDVKHINLICEIDIFRIYNIIC